MITYYHIVWATFQCLINRVYSSGVGIILCRYNILYIYIYINSLYIYIYVWICVSVWIGMYVYVYVTCNMFYGINKSQKWCSHFGSCITRCLRIPDCPMATWVAAQVRFRAWFFLQDLVRPGRNLGRCWICIRKSSTADATGWLGMTGFGETVIAPSWLRKLGFTAQLSVYIINIYIYIHT